MRLSPGSRSRSKSVKSKRICHSLRGIACSTQLRILASAPKVSKPLAIVIPTYNEGQNFPSLWSLLCSQIRSPFIAFVIYDFDEDDTVPAVQRIVDEGEGKIRLVKNNIRKGVVGAILTGFNQVEHGPVLVVMADLSDDLGQVDPMLALYSDGYHVVVGSRYMKGGRIEGGPWLKQLLSRLAGLTLHWFRGIPTHDATNAFKIYDRDMLKSFTIESQQGFELNLELTVKAFLAGYRIAEVPSRWRDRSRGQSRFRLWAWLPHYLRWYFYAFQPRHSLDAAGKR
jgi:dolichol-phosphate mannosyltransferase